jgi:tetratricopeptide (TPR) repeat protein
MEEFHLGNSLVIEENFEASLELYNSALDSNTLDDETSRMIYSNRALVNLELKDYAGCIGDCNRSISIKNDHELTYLRKGRACFELDEYESALIALQKGLKLRQSQQPNKSVLIYQRLIRKCESEIQEGINMNASSNSSNKSNTPPSESGYYGDNSQNVDDDFDYPIDTEDQQVIVPLNSVASQESNKIQSDAIVPVQETESFNPENTQLVVKSESTIIKKACSLAIILPLVAGALIPLIFTIDGETIDFSSLDDGEKLDKLLDLKNKGKINNFTINSEN